jgi:hypothetical protein
MNRRLQKERRSDAAILSTNQPESWWVLALLDNVNNCQKVIIFRGAKGLSNQSTLLRPAREDLDLLQTWQTLLEGEPGVHIGVPTIQEISDDKIDISAVVADQSVFEKICMRRERQISLHHLQETFHMRRSGVKTLPMQFIDPSPQRSDDISRLEQHHVVLLPPEIERRRY